MSSILIDNNTAPITKDQFPKAISYLQNDAPGYQIDFRRIDRVNDPSMTMDDCRLYGIDSTAITVCLKKVDHSLLAGIHFISKKALTKSVEFMSRSSEIAV
jgi:hypothetical protein